MAASNSQRRWNRFFENGGAPENKPAQKRTRKAKTTCRNYSKPTESCRLNGEPCLSPGHCPDYSRRDDIAAPPIVKKYKQDETAPKHERPASAGNSEGHAMPVTGKWGPEDKGDWNFVQGYTVLHKYFGKGTVILMDRERDRVEVEFESVGRKVLLASFFQKNPVMKILR